jgi:hypothetical protein
VIGQRGAWVFSIAGAAAAEGKVVDATVSRVSNGDVLALSTYKMSPAGMNSSMSTRRGY